MKKQVNNKYLLFFSAFIFSLIVSLSNPLLASATEDTDEETPTYTIGTDTTYAPFEFEDEDGNFVGIDMDILAAIAEDQGFEYEINALGFNAAVQALESGQVDAVIAGMTITPEREETFDFSDPYYEAGTVFGVDADSEYQNLEDLDGENVAVKTGTTGAIIAEEMAEEYNYTLTQFEDSANMYADVIAGNSAAAVEDTPVMQYAISTGAVDFRLITDTLEAMPLGMAFRQDENEELQQMFNEGLMNIQASGEYEEILERYLGEDALADRRVETGFFGQLTDNIGRLASGLWTTLWITLVSIAIALVIGIVLGLMRTSGNKLLSGIAIVYIDAMRGTPMIVFSFFIYFGIPQILNVNLSAVQAGILTLSINAAAYIGEIVRGGINAVDVGQKEASRSLGMSSNMTMRYVVLPQAIKIMIPSLINQFVITLKDSSILSVIGLVELTQTGRIIIARTLQSGTMWLIVGLMYIIVITILTKLSNRLEKEWV